MNRIVDLLVGLPLRIVLITFSWLFWSIFMSLDCVGSGDWSQFRIQIPRSYRWAWKPQLEPDFWPKDSGNDGFL